MESISEPERGPEALNATPTSSAGPHPLRPSPSSPGPNPACRTPRPQPPAPPRPPSSTSSPASIPVCSFAAAVASVAAAPLTPADAASCAGLPSPPACSSDPGPGRLLERQLPRSPRTRRARATALRLHAASGRGPTAGSSLLLGDGGSRVSWTRVRRAAFLAASLRRSSRCRAGVPRRRGIRRSAAGGRLAARGGRRGDGAAAARWPRRGDDV